MKAIIFVILLFLTSLPVSAQKDELCLPQANIDSMSYVKPTKVSIEHSDYALVAGGSKGIGYSIAQALAKRKFNLILIARHQDALDKAKERLEKDYKVHVELLKLDLEHESTADSIARWCTSKNIHLKMLCNVAGLGGPKDYLSLPLDSLRYMVRLNVESCMALTLTLLPLLEKNKPSYILNVASMAGLAPIPTKNMYSATKSAVIFFSYALREQLRKKDISVSCLSPGPVFTKPEIVQYTKQQLGWFGMKMAVSPERVGEIAVRGTLRGKMMIIPGTLAKISSFFIRILPRRWVVSLYGTAATD
ncbi:SDR family oxidoreductase [Flavobacterium sp. JAS]|uniref:SDR family NAD(P)-dependent oxidoreductase n=1 Tax=Flavobacterium sp. JAS TaxID=2897329 RepID=UPI001E37132A|nr:SDR family NAD(P)-dependent oxidoreductase [Flavobacterium sp. JAS]MCD0472686.1 SDR family NAD(P)-dependent oxidoreductase [Flavobacterium sp. JAS]